MVRTCLISLGLFGALLLMFTSTQAESAANNIYILTSNWTVDTVTVFDRSTGQDEILYSVSRELNGVPPDFYPQAEIDAYNEFLPEYKVNGETKDFSLNDLPIIAGITAMAISPDKQQMVIQVTYKSCRNLASNLCYGTTQLILVDLATKNQRLLLNLGRHTVDYFLEESQSKFYTERMQVVVWSIQWTPNQQAIIIGVNDSNSWRSLPRRTIVVIPIDGSQPFRVGEGTIWTIAPTGNQIAVLSDEKDVRSYVNILTIIDFDLISGQSSSHEYSLRQYAIQERAGLGYIGQLPLFYVAFDASIPGEGGEVSGGLAAFNPQTTTLSMLPPHSIGGAERLEATLDGTIVLIQTRDSTVSQVVLDDSKFTLKPLNLPSNAGWSLGDYGDLLIQLENYTYQFIDLQGKVLGEFSLAQIQALKTDEETHILGVDW